MEKFNAEGFEVYGKQAITDWLLGYNKVIELMGEIKDKNILDYGCGDGKFSRKLNELKANVTGVDVLREMVDLAKKTGPKEINYIQIESAKLDKIKDNSLDFASSNYCLCALPTKKEIEEILKSIHKKLKKGGKMFALNVNWERFNGKESISWKCDKITPLKSGSAVSLVLKSIRPIKGIDYYFSKEDYVKMFTKTGYKNIVVKEIRPTTEKADWIDETKYSPTLIIYGEK